MRSAAWATCPGKAATISKPATSNARVWRWPGSSAIDCAQPAAWKSSLVATAQGQAERAARLFGAASSWWRAMGVRLLPSDRADHEAGVLAARSLLSANRFDAAWSDGSDMSTQQTVDLGLSDVEELAASVNASGPGAPLTMRKQEVALLVAHGLTNHDIAERLEITQRTAEAHVTHILSKLGLRSRAQIAPWTVEHGLIQVGKT